MTKNTNQYELLVSELLLSDFDFGSNTVISSFHKKKYKGKDTIHEIDVSYEVEMSSLKILIVVECKLLKKKATKKDLEIFNSRFNDISANIGIFVTTQGFEKGAIDIAKSNKIKLVTVKDGFCSYFMGEPPVPIETEKLFQYFPDLQTAPNMHVEFICQATNSLITTKDYGEYRDLPNKEGFYFSDAEYYIMPDNEIALNSLGFRLLFFSLALSCLKSSDKYKEDEHLQKDIAECEVILFEGFRDRSSM